MVCHLPVTVPVGIVPNPKGSAAGHVPTERIFWQWQAEGRQTATQTESAATPGDDSEQALMIRGVCAPPKCSLKWLHSKSTLAMVEPCVLPVEMKKYNKSSEPTEVSSYIFCSTRHA